MQQRGRTGPNAQVIQFPSGKRLTSATDGPDVPPRLVSLRTLEFTIAAPASVVMRTLASLGNEVERRSRLERVVAFQRRTMWQRRYLTTEILELEPACVRSRWLTGPLPFVEETIECVQVAVDRTELTCDGSFQPRSSRLSRATAWLTRLGLQRDRRRRLREARRIGEARFALNRSTAARHPSHPAGTGLVGGASHEIELVHSSDRSGPDEPIA
jgi:hypothetical protein